MKTKLFSYSILRIILFILFLVPIVYPQKLPRKLALDSIFFNIDTVHINSQKVILIKRTALIDNTGNDPGVNYRQTFKISHIYDSITQTISDSGHQLHSYEMKDMNEDGDNDLVIQDDSYDLIMPENVWLYKPETKLFEYCKVLSGESDLYPDNGVYSTNDPSTGGKGGYSTKFILQNGEKKVIETINSNYFEYEKKILINNELTIVEQDQEESKETQDGTIITITSKKIVFDSLRIVKVSIIRDLYQHPVSGDVDNDVLRGEPFGNFIYIKEETFDYKRRPNESLQVVKSTRNVVNNKWGHSIKEIIQ